MKKYFCLLLVIAMLLALVACGATTAPPSDSGNTPNSTDAPTDSGTNTPPVSTQSHTPDASTSAPPAVAADISELTLNLDAISLSATVNSDDTVSYTYKDTSLKPAYVSDKAMEFYITVYGTDATSSPITSTFFSLESQPQGDGKHILDLTSMLGVDFKRQDIPVTVDANGLTITWNAPLEDTGVGLSLDDLEAFIITTRLIVGGTDVFSEQLRYGMEVMD